MNLEWLLPLISAVGACIAFFLSKPRRPLIAALAVFFIATAAAWEASNRFAEMQSRHELRAAIHKTLLGVTDSFLDIISEGVFRSTEGWLPKTEEEFFSNKTAALLCQKLDISRPAPIVPRRSWRTHLYEVSGRFKEALEDALERHALILDADLIRNLDVVRNSFFLSHAALGPVSHKIDLEHNVIRPPLFCWGLEPLMEESLAELFELYLALKCIEEESGYEAARNWLVFPLPHHQYFLGESRFGPDDLRTWMIRFPDSAGPAKFGRGNPNKTSVNQPN